MEAALLDDAADLCSGTEWLHNSGEINHLMVSNKLLKTQVAELEKKFTDARDEMDVANKEIIHQDDLIFELKRGLAKAKAKLDLSDEYSELKDAYKHLDDKYQVDFKPSPVEVNIIKEATELHNRSTGYIEEYNERNGTNR